MDTLRIRLYVLRKGLHRSIPIDSTDGIGSPRLEDPLRPTQVQDLSVFFHNRKMPKKAWKETGKNDPMVSRFFGLWFGITPARLFSGGYIMFTIRMAPYCIVNVILLLRWSSIFSNCVRRCDLIYEDLQRNFLSLGEDRPAYEGWRFDRFVDPKKSGIPFLCHLEVEPRWLYRR